MDAADKITIACPICRTRFVIGLQHAGKVVRCRCSAKIQVPELAKKAGTLPRAAEPSPVERSQPLQPALPAQSPETEQSCPQCQRRLRSDPLAAPQTGRCPCGHIFAPSSPVQTTAPPERDLLETDFAFDFDSPTPKGTQLPRIDPLAQA